LRQYLVFITLLLLLPATRAFAEITTVPHVMVLEEYDSNISYTAENELSDWITRTQTGVDIIYEGKVDRAKLTADVYHRFYQKYSEFDNTSEDLFLDVTHEFTKYDSMRLTDHLTHSTEPTSLEAQFDRGTGRYAYSSNDLEITYYHDVTSQLRNILRFGNQLDYRSRSDLTDSTLYSLSEGVEYAFNSRDIGLAEIGYAMRDYSLGGDIQSYYLTLGLRHYFSSQLSLQAVAGYGFLTNTQNSTSGNPTYSLTLTDEVTDQLRAILAYSWQNSTSASSSDAFKSERVSFGLIDQVNLRLRVDLNAFYGSGTYDTSKTKNTLSGASAGFAYELFRATSLVASISYTQQDSNVLTDEYTRTFASVGIRREF